MNATPKQRRLPFPARPWQFRLTSIAQSIRMKSLSAVAILLLLSFCMPASAQDLAAVKDVDALPQLSPLPLPVPESIATSQPIPAESPSPLLLPPEIANLPLDVITAAPRPVPPAIEQPPVVDPA